jgi:hypothetical protein
MSEPDDKRLHGWKEIATALGVSVRAAQMRLHWRDPLPVRWGHRGPWQWRSAVRDWVHRQDMDYKVALELGIVRGARRRASLRNPARPDADGPKT